MNKTVKILATLFLSAALPLLSASLLTGCGQKGPLIQAPAAKPAASSPTAP